MIDPELKEGFKILKHMAYFVFLVVFIVLTIDIIPGFILTIITIAWLIYSIDQVFSEDKATG